jgi:hypothetical protein
MGAGKFPLLFLDILHIRRISNNGVHLAKQGQYLEAVAAVEDVITARAFPIRFWESRSNWRHWVSLSTIVIVLAA